MSKCIGEDCTHPDCIRGQEVGIGELSKRLVGMKNPIGENRAARRQYAKELRRARNA